MNLTLDAQTEQRIQRVLAHGPYREPSELINHALDLLADEEDWLVNNKAALHQHLEESMAQIRRGEGIPGDQLLDYLARRRSVRTT